VKKKILIPIVFVAILLCAVSLIFKYIEPKEPANPVDANEPEVSAPADSISTEVPDQNNIAAVPGLGGVSLGDSPEKVISVLGNDYTESIEIDNGGIIGEDIIVWNYEKGIVVSFGKTTGKVIRVVSSSPDFHTDLGIKVGDNAKTAFELYKSKFKEAISRHSNEVLEGWFHIGDEAVMIFDFDKSDRAVTNRSVTPDSDIEEIILAYWKHFN